MLVMNITLRKASPCSISPCYVGQNTYFFKQSSSPSDVFFRKKTEHLIRRHMWFRISIFSGRVRVLPMYFP